MLPSSAMRLGARPEAPSRMRVSGFSANSTRSQATSGTRRKYRCILSALSTRQIIAFESSRRFNWKILFTASSLLASHPMPHIVSVGYRIIPPCLSVCTAVLMSSAISFCVINSQSLTPLYTPLSYSFFISASTTYMSPSSSTRTFRGNKSHAS